MKKTITLHRKGSLIVVTDIHGNKEDFDKYIEIWDKKNSDCHILFTGDLIHSHDGNEQCSIDILNDVEKYMTLPNFHVLMGNHELAQISDESMCKYECGQTKQFKHHILYKIDEEHLKSNRHEELIKYTDIISKFDYFALTDNGFFFSHAGINNQLLNCLINQSIDLFNLNIKKEKDYRFLESMLWSRPYDDYTEKDIENFLKIINCKYMCVGHTDYDGMHILGNQLIFNSSCSTKKKYYLDIDLRKDYKNIFEVIKQLKVIK